MTRRLIVAAALSLAVASCSDPETAKRAVEDMGMSNVETQGYAFFGCGKDDEFHTSFTAINSSGRRVSGVVCSGYLKGATVRIK
jgi:hypothetical protein